MAIMRTCCCCGVRSGSIASAIYSLIIGLLGVANFVYSLHYIDVLKGMLYQIQYDYPELFGDLDVDTYVSLGKASYIFALIILAATFLTSIVVIIGINKDSKVMLIPFMVTKGVGFIWYLFASVLGTYYATKIGVQYGGTSLMAVLVLLVPFLIGDIVCLLCVISQYQEYRDGRGRLTDDGLTQRQTVVFQKQPLTSGPFGYAKLQDPPPAYVAHKNVPGAI